MKQFRILLLIACLSTFHRFCPGNDLSFTRLSVENGLSNNRVKAIFKDTNGFIWFGTLEGLDRYDGVEIRSYSSKFPDAVENIFVIAEDFQKQLWVGTESGLFCYNGMTDRFDRIRIDSITTTVQTMVIMPDSNLCIGTTNGLYFVNPKNRTAEHPLFPEDINNRVKNITGVIADELGNCWLSTLYGLLKYSVKDEKFDHYLFNTTPLNAHNTFIGICNIGHKLFMGTRDCGVVEFDCSSKVFTPVTDINHNLILSINSDKKERLFVGTDGGGLKIVNRRTNHVESIENQENRPFSISSNSITSFFLDENNRYWLGTFAGGVSFVKNIAERFKLHPVTLENPAFNKCIRSFYFAPDGAEYFGTKNGFIQISKKGVTNFYKANPENKSGLRANTILAIFPFGSDILLGTYGGGISLFSVSEQRIKPFLDSELFYSGNIYGFETDKNGNLWIASHTGIYKYSPTEKSIVNFNKKNCGLQYDEIFDIFFDSKGRLWVGTKAGLLVFTINDNGLTKVKLPKLDVDYLKISYIYEDHSGNFWICTERGGLIMIDRELTNSKTYHNINGLSDNSVCAIIESNSGEYWISTLKGFCKFSFESQKFTKFTLSEGLPGLVFSTASTHLSPDGTLYFGNENGLVYFNPKETDNQIFTSKIRLTDFYLSGKRVIPGPKSVLQQPIELTDEIRLNDGSSSIGFRFVALNYIHPSDNEYLCKMEGLDKEWKNNGNNTTVFYEKLKPGRYRFKVRTSSESDDNSLNNAEISITVHHSLLSSPLFWGFLLLFMSVGVLLVVNYIIKLQKNGKPLSGQPEIFEKYKGSKITEMQSAMIIIELKRYMDEKKPYMNADLKLGDLATEINYPLHEISQVINQDLNQSFSGFVNKYRIEEVKKQIACHAYEKFTLYAIAQQCGFNSKTSFYRIFKKETGKTPADYLKDQIDL